MKNPVLLAIDQGTTGSTALIVDASLNVVSKHTVEFPQHFPKPGWVEHDLNEIWKSVLDAVEGALVVAAKSGVSASSVAAIGITNQRETTCAWYRDESGTPAAKAIVWQDRRTADHCDALRKRGLAKTLHRKTGLILDPYFSGTKMSWFLKNVPEIRRGAMSGKVIFGTIESYLLYRLTGQYRTDVSNASRTLLMDLKKTKWDADLLKIFGVKVDMLPEIVGSCEEYGTTRGFLNIPKGTPVTGLIGDQQAALFGQACFRNGMAKCTYGTGAFAMMNIGTEPTLSKNRLLTTVAWQLGGKTTYALEGSSFVAGAAVQWLRDGLGLFAKAAEVESLAETVASSDGVLFVPSLTGLGAPHWLPRATGLITGLTRGTTKSHVARATLEGIAYQVEELMTAMVADSGKKLGTLRVDGGAAADNLLMQFQTDLLGTRVERATILETTALGAALQAGLTVGVWSSLKQIEALWSEERAFTAKMPLPERKRSLARWKKTVEAVRMLSE